MGGVLLDEKKQEKGKVPQNDTFPTHIGRQCRPLGALRAFREARNWCATCLRLAPQMCYRRKLFHYPFNTQNIENMKGESS